MESLFSNDANKDTFVIEGVDEKDFDNLFADAILDDSKNMNVFVIIDEKGNSVLNAPLFVSKDQSIEDFKKSLIDYFSRYSDYDSLQCEHIAYYITDCYFFDMYCSEDLSFVFYMDNSIREAEKNLIREKVKFETYRDNAVAFYEKYSHKEKKKRCLKKK